MEGQKSNYAVPIIVAIITVAGSIIAAIISNRPATKDIPEIKSSFTLTHPDQPNFNELSTFCDTLKYFIKQNHQQYSWLKQNIVSRDEEVTEYDSKIKFLNFPTIIENDADGWYSTVDVLETFDNEEAIRLFEIILRKFMVCLDNYTVHYKDEIPMENWVSEVYKFENGFNELSIELMYRSDHENPVYFLTIYF